MLFCMPIGVVHSLVFYLKISLVMTRSPTYYHTGIAQESICSNSTQRHVFGSTNKKQQVVALLASATAGVASLASHRTAIHSA